MPSSKETRKQRHQAQIKTQPGKPIRGAQSTEFVKGAGYRKAEFVGSKKFYTPMSTDPTSSGAGGDTTNITISGGGLTQGAVLADGTVPFNNTQSGITPTESNHLATKNYVDNNATSFELTGDITGGTSGASGVVTTIASNAVENAMLADNAVSTAEIANNSVTIAKLQQLATDTFLGRNTAGTGNVEVITLDDLETMLQMNTYLQSASTNSLTDVTVNNSTVTTGHYLRHNGTNFVNTTFNAADISGLQASQIPVIDISSKTTGTLPVNRGGTGATSGYNSSNWNTAYTWGDHGAAGYMSSFIITETDAGTSTVNNGKYVKFASSNSGSHGNSTVTGNGSSGDPFVVTLNTPDTNTFQQTTFTLTADSGSNQTIAHGNTLDIEGGTGVSTAVGSTDKVTINVTGNLPTLSGLNVSDGNFIVGNGSAFTVESGATARSSLGLGSAAVRAESFFKLTGATETVGRGGTGHDDLTNNAVLTGNGTSPISVESNFVYDGTSLGVNTSSPRAVSGYSLVTINTTGANGAGIDFQLSGTSKASVYTVAGTLYADAVTSHIFRTGGAMGGTTALTLSSSQVATFASTIRGGADVVAYYSSDPTLKENKKLIQSPLDKISQLGGYSFDWKEEAKDMVGDHLNGKDYGVMADEVQALFPELVDTRSNGIRAVKYDKLVPLLIEGIKELKEELNMIKEQS